MRCFVLITLCALLGCDGGDGSADAGSDSTSYPDLGPADCPLNSGWPCSCYSRGPCADGNICARFGSLGVCAAECIPGEPPGSACPEHDFTGQAHCQLQAEPGGAPTHCLISCAHSDNCPSNQECRNISSTTGLGQCLP